MMLIIPGGGFCFSCRPNKNILSSLLVSISSIIFLCCPFTSFINFEARKPYSGKLQNNSMHHQRHFTEFQFKNKFGLKIASFFI